MPDRPIPVARIRPPRRRELQRAYEVIGQLLLANREIEALPLAQQCVANDPDNRLYVQRLLTTLERVFPVSFGRSSLPARFAERSRLKALRKLGDRKDWLGVFETALTLLGEKPNSVASARVEILSALAASCHASNCFEAELAWLQDAGQTLDAAEQMASRQAETFQLEKQQASVQERLARAYTRHGRLAEAEALQSRDSSPLDSQQENNSQIADLEQQLALQPANIDLYLQLAELYHHRGQLAEAESTLQQALFVEPSPKVTALLEETQIAIADARVQAARSRSAEPQFAGEDEAAATRAAVERLENERLRIRCEIYRARSDRDRSDAASRLALAGCLFDLGNTPAALQELQGSGWPDHLQGEAELLIAECHALAGRAAEAALHFQNASKLLATSDRPELARRAAESALRWDLERDRKR